MGVLREQCRCYNSPDLVHKVGRDTGARGTDRVSEGDGTTVHVQLVHIKAELLCYSQRLRCKRLIHLEIIDRKTCLYYSVLYISLIIQRLFEQLKTGSPDLVFLVHVFFIFSIQTYICIVLIDTGMGRMDLITI